MGTAKAAAGIRRDKGACCFVSPFCFIVCLQLEIMQHWGFSIVMESHNQTHAKHKVGTGDHVVVTGPEHESRCAPWIAHTTDPMPEARTSVAQV